MLIRFSSIETSYLYIWCYEADLDPEEPSRPEPKKILEAIFSLNMLVTSKDMDSDAMQVDSSRPKRLELLEDVSGSPRLLLLRGSKEVQTLFTQWLATRLDCAARIRTVSPAAMELIAAQLLLLSVELNKNGEGAALAKALQRSVEFNLSIPESMGISGLRTFALSFSRAEVAALYEKVADVYKAHRIHRCSGDVVTGTASDELVGGALVRMILSHAANLLKLDLNLLNITKFACPVGIVSLGGNLRVCWRASLLRSFRAHSFSIRCFEMCMNTF